MLVILLINTHFDKNNLVFALFRKYFYLPIIGSKRTQIAVLKIANVTVAYNTDKNASCHMLFYFT